MAKQNLASMSVEALLKLRDDIAVTLSEKTSELKKQLARLTGGGAVGRGRRGRSLKARKVAPKYRGPNGETWAGRGARPRWMQEAIKAGAKPDDFLITQGASGRKKPAAKKS